LNLQPAAAPHAPVSLQDLARLVPGYRADDLPVQSAQAFLTLLATAWRDGRPAGTNPAAQVAIEHALGRVLARDMVSPVDVPARDNAAMDGYALRAADLSAQGDRTYPIAGISLAGRPFQGDVPAGHCVRIMTGAALPAGLDTVVPQELALTPPSAPPGAQGTSVCLATRCMRPGANRRARAEDLACGQVVLAAGRVLRPADLGLLASLGLASIPVQPRLKVAVLSSGDELRQPGQTLGDAGLYDSNGATLRGMLQRLGCEVVDQRVARDTPDSLEAALCELAGLADVVITSGGVSAGDADHLRNALQQLGDVVGWQLAMRPGRPMAVACLPQAACPSDAGPSEGRAPTLVFALPGNPVAVMVCFYVLLRDALLRLGGATCAPLPMLQATTMAALRKRAGRTEYLRGIVEPGPGGAWQVRTTGDQGSGILRSMSQANGLIVLPHDSGDVAAGARVDVVPFEGLV
jgi:molybdopterin molybdotransferase